MKDEDAEPSKSTCYRKQTVEDLFKVSNTPVKICAPMVRYSKLAFRTLVREYGCDLAFTPMIVANAFVKSEQARNNEFTTNDDDAPLIVQFAANNGIDLANAAELVALYSDGIDLNCGCPQRWAMAECYGAHLINDPHLVQDMVKQTTNRVANPRFSISLKIRIHDDIRRTVEFCRQAEKAGISFVTVHGRTVLQRTEPVSIEAIHEICKSVSMPVIANGDIRSLEDVEKVHHATGVAGVMAARGLLQNPALFSGYAITPPECIGRWLNIALETGTSFTSLHHHLVYMTSGQMSCADRRLFTSLSSISAVLDFLEENYDIKPISQTNQRTE